MTKTTKLQIEEQEDEPKKFLANLCVGDFFFFPDDHDLDLFTLVQCGTSQYMINLRSANAERVNDRSMSARVSVLSEVNIQVKE